MSSQGLSVLAVALLNTNAIVMKNAFSHLKSARGFSVTDMLASMAVIATCAAIATPQMINALDSMRLGMAVRDVERELQFARLKSVAVNRPMRIRFDCPVAGQLRVIELIGSSALPDANDADTYTNRCNETTYPYHPAGGDRLRRPSNDGPVRYLQAGTTFTAKKTMEFWPDGSVHADTGAGNPWPNIGLTGVTITLSRKGKTKNITVNGFGKIYMDR
jgi:Tfp pilus assembly protein FimT